VARGVQTRQLLLDAAEAELVARDGVLEVAGVAARAGTTTGALYHHFASKAGLLVATVDAFYDRHHERVIAPDLTGHGGWADRERVRTGLTVAFHYDEPLAPVVLGTLAREPEAAATEAARIAQLVAAAERNLLRAQDAGEVPASVDAGLAGAVIVGGVRQALGQVLARPRRPPREGVADSLWRLVGAAVLDRSAGPALRGPA
jgi:AcrR family transcriptional regulator